jgi:hypothetical protein
MFSQSFAGHFSQVFWVHGLRVAPAFALKATMVKSRVIPSSDFVFRLAKIE